MKKIFTLLSLVVFTSVSFAQLVAPRPGTPQYVKQNDGRFKSLNPLIPFTSIELDQYLNRASLWEWIPASPAGYIFGTSYYNSGGHYYPINDATGCHFDGIGPAVVTDVLVWAGEKKIVGAGDSITLNVYDVAADTTPTTWLGTYKFSTDTLDTTGAYGFPTDIPITANITSSFLVTVEYPGINDTISFFSSDPDTFATTQHPSGMGDGRGEKRARQRLLVSWLGHGAGWNAIQDIYNGSEDADVMFMPIVDVANGVSEFRNELFTLKRASPNPSSGMVHLDYTLISPTQVSYNVMDARGRLIYRSGASLKSASTYNETIDLTAFPPGNYYVTFNAGSKTLSQKVILVK